VRVTVLPSLRQSDLGSRVNGVSEGMTHFRTVDTSYEAIPIRATLLSALTLVIFVCFFVFYNWISLL
jgi:hypothetical protein